MPKTILITGATDGIGVLTAKKLAAQGHTVHIHGRSDDKLTAAAAQVGGEPGTFNADLSELSEVYAMAEEVKAHADHIDVLVNNAGVFKTPDPTTSSGLDTRFVVNAIAPYVLTEALLDVIPKEGRVVNLSSAAQAPVDLAALRGNRRLDDMQAYAQSKLAITAWTYEMAQRHPDGPVFVSVNPGSLLASKMVKEGFGVAGNDLNIGADILCRAALDESFANASGKYFDNDAGAFSPIDGGATRPAFLQDLMTAMKEIAASN